ncbi:MAG: hypothetical protein IIY21_29485 [Clostridiales bacterium]|nr:hypothetical protein [Lachnospiraceae bacterium]MBQ1298209.1 hypothetical protein [Clostridiales bacterium]MBQ5769302.1 hypothetical protein [Clostridiales bacterium]
MKNEMQVFNNEEFGSVRTLTIDNQPWFVGKDVAVALGYGKGNNDSKAITHALDDHVDEEDKKHLSYDELKGYQNGHLKTFSHYGSIVINESGLYSLILSSKLKSAKKFKRWVTSEVLPAIRLKGEYRTDPVRPKNIAEVIKLAEFTKKTMREAGRSEAEVQKAIKELGDNYGVEFPRCLDKPGNLNDWYDMIDFIFEYKNKGLEPPSDYNQYLIERTKRKRIGGE